ncbi:MAG: RsmB/NOP family class I SAM-dependent RNA methyltransferase [Lachnospiraceae bacterium]|nr:RsmB/NOP family class I SAM-dependent RNA methyltransferase [Lachnospiraceae bacterium]
MDGITPGTKQGDMQPCGPDHFPAFPEGFPERMRELLGDEYPDFLSSYSDPPVRSLKINTLRKPEGFSPSFVLEDPEAVTWEDEAWYIGEGERPGLDPLHMAGAYYIQEASAMRVVPELDVRPGMRVLDLCAAPGGKSVQTAMRLRGEGLLVSAEPVPARAKVLAQNIERMGIWNACVLNAGPDEVCPGFPGFFDRVLVDAPCSGEGMFRKNPEAMGEWSVDNVRMCAERQRAILEQAVKALKPGGRLVYSTCTYEREEDEEQALWLSSATELELVGEGRIMPHRQRGEGQYFAAFEFREKGEREKSFEPYIPHEGSEGDPAVIRKTLDLINENLAKPLPRGRIVCSQKGNHVYLSPVGAGMLKGLRVQREGLPLVDVDKYGRYNLSHSLAMFLRPGDTLRSYEMNPDEARAFLHGDVVRGVEKGNDGMTLMCFRGFSMGWGSKKGNIIKNHLPKGLRT